MPDLTLSASMTLSKAPLVLNLIMQLQGQTASMATASYVRKSQVILTASKTAINLGDVTTPGWAVIVNTDSGHDCTIFPDASNPSTIKIPAGKAVLIYFLTTTPYAQFATANGVLDYLIASQ